MISIALVRARSFKGRRWRGLVCLTIRSVTGSNSHNPTFNSRNVLRYSRAIRAVAGGTTSLEAVTQYVSEYGSYLRVRDGAIESVAGLEGRLRAARRPVEFFTYAGTGHWFFEDDRPGAYHAAAAQKAWARTLRFLHKHLNRRSKPARKS